MLKAKAIELLGGSLSATARAVGVSYQAVKQWPPELPRRIEDRVLAALARERMPSLLDPSPQPECPESEQAINARGRTAGPSPQGARNPDVQAC